MSFVDDGSGWLVDNGGPFILVTDDSSCWYVIPVSKETQWGAWIGSQQWEDGDVPEYATAVGGSPTLVQFSNFVIHGVTK